MALVRIPVFLPVLGSHYQRPVVCHVFSHFSFMVLEPYEKHVHCVFTSVCERAINRAIAPHDHVQKTAWLVLLCFHCVARIRGRLASLDLSEHTFEVCVNYIWCLHLLVMVHESHLVFSFFRHLRSGRVLQQPFALWFVSFKRIDSLIPMQAAFAEMFTFIVSVLVIQ